MTGVLTSQLHATSLTKMRSFSASHFFMTHEPVVIFPLAKNVFYDLNLQDKET